MGDLCRFCEELGYGGVKRSYRFDSFKKFRELTMETDLLLAIDRHKKREVHIWLDAEKTWNMSVSDGGVPVGDGGVAVGDGGVALGDGGVPVGDGDKSVPVGDGDRSVLEDEGDQCEDEDFCASMNTDSGFDDILFEEYVEAEECGHNQRTCEWKKLAESGLQDGAFDMGAEAEELTQGDEFPLASLFSESQPQSQPQSQMNCRRSTIQSRNPIAFTYLCFSTISDSDLELFLQNRWLEMKN
ncbi:UDP-N-acetylglucosamine--N-acetylmuramyl-(pentapeptide) pyrophosphoryl-undecaprenol N-acetylglucosaminetransferase [Striga asiatica]|uniref:UDP-N-acetylglucosamine--N-acetylmuramyl-(Pentapeptide) pyrophosphoryl-undecaprenol N-acetylglucosaminetransferase n=1 Tax=Striga asiatica TaxID=4170 RepID=A0A5A7PJ05_STRAF|nr:UDP-N-acetylglucosamine--N-acetylmuramyl-(pentapeptide) pyrophosphoryl-undecaprenol N-acetylglucosaminetransferase [Striga asiatica]